jgi:threonine 3-dehydrogenase
MLIKVHSTGICGTDLHILQDPPAHPAKIGVILGHEFSGEIADIQGHAEGYSVGDRVLVDPHPGCGVCDECRKGYPDNCIPLYQTSGEKGHPDTIGIFSDGAFTGYTVVPRQSVYKIHPDVPSYITALAEPLACVCNAVEKIKVQPGDYVLIIGAGPIGLLFTMLLRANGASKIIVSEPSEYRREMAGKAGADMLINPLTENLEDKVMNETGRGVDAAIEAVGPFLPDCIKLIRPGGRILQFGHDESVNPSVPVGMLLKKEATIYGAFIGKACFETATRIMESGKLPLDQIVSHHISLREIHKGIDLLRKGEALKIMVSPE